MECVIVRTVLPYESYELSSPDDLRKLLSVFQLRFASKPRMVVLSESNGDTIMFGVGAKRTTIEMLLRSQKKHVRSQVSETPYKEATTFSYSGEFTEVDAEYLVDSNDGFAAIVTWIESHVLDSLIEWSVQDWPPKNWTKRANEAKT